MWEEVTNGVPSISILHPLVNLYLFNIKQQKGSAYKTAETHQVQIQHPLSDTLQMFIFVQKNGELAFLHLKAGSEYCIPGRVRGKPYIKRKKAKPILLKQSKSREISLFLTTCRPGNIKVM